MNYLRNAVKQVVKLKIGMILLIVLFMITVCLSCDGAVTLRVKNETSRALAIYVSGTDINAVPQPPLDLIGKMKPGEELTNNGLTGRLNYYYFEAKDENNNIIYSRFFTNAELANIHWKIIIQ